MQILSTIYVSCTTVSMLRGMSRSISNQTKTQLFITIIYLQKIEKIEKNDQLSIYNPSLSASKQNTYYANIIQYFTYSFSVRT